MPGPGFGQFVSSEPAGPGLYRFGLADGTSRLLGGAPAEDLNRRLLAGMPKTEGMLAANDAVPAPAAPQLSDAPAPSSVAQSGQANSGLGTLAKVGAAALPALSALPGAAPALAVAGLAGKAFGGLSGGSDAAKRAEKTPDGPPPSAAPAEPGAAPGPTQQASAQTAEPSAAPAQQEGAFLGYSAKGANGIEGPVMIHNGVPMVYVAPTKGSPGGFTKLGTQTVEQHQTARTGAAQAEMLAAQAQAAGVQAEAENIAAQSAAADEAKWQAAVAANDQQEEVKATEARVADLRGRYAKARETAASGKIDENQYMKGGKGLLSAIGMALGAFGAVLGRSPNFAQEFVEGQIQKNIRRQEADLQSKRDTEKNALGELTQELGSLNLAKSALAQMYRDRVAADRESAALSGKADAMQKYNLAVAEGLRARTIKEDANTEMAFREHVMGNKLYYQQGRAGSAGGFAPLTQEAYEKGAAGARANEELRIKQDKAEGAGKNPHIGQRQQSQIISAKVAGGAIQEYADALGVKRGKDGEYTDPSWGSTGASKVPFSDTRQKVTALKNTLVAEVGKAQIGGVLSEGEAHTMQKQIEDANTPGEIGAMLRHYDRTMRHVEHTVREVAASSGPGSDEPYDSESRR